MRFKELDIVSKEPAILYILTGERMVGHQPLGLGLVVVLDYFMGSAP